MHSIKRHYAHVAKEIELTRPANTADLCAPVVVLPIDRWSAVSEKALRYAWTLSQDIHVVHVACGEETDQLRQQWHQMVVVPARAAGLEVPKLAVLESPYRFIVRPIVNYALEQQKLHVDRTIAVLIPELVESHWYHYLLHNNRSEAIRAMLLVYGNQRITVVTIPYHLQA